MSQVLDPRVERTRQVVVAAASDLLAEAGIAGTTIDAVAERSGVARSTIYRNWPDRADLFAEVFSHVCALPDVPDTGSLVGDFRVLGEHLVHGVQDEAWGRMLGSIVAAADHDDTVRRALVAFGASRRQGAVAIVQRAIDRGEVSVDEDAAGRACERFASGFFFRRLFSRAPLDEAFVSAQIEALRRELGA